MNSFDKLSSDEFEYNMVAIDECQMLNIKCATSKLTSVSYKMCLNSELWTFNPYDNSMFHTQSHLWINAKCFGSDEVIPNILGSTKFYSL